MTSIHQTGSRKRGGKQYIGSRKQRAVRLYIAMTHGKQKPARKDVITRFTEELGIKEQSASLYNHLLQHGNWDNLIRAEKRAVKA